MKRWLRWALAALAVSLLSACIVVPRPGGYIGYPEGGEHHHHHHHDD